MRNLLVSTLLSSILFGCGDIKRPIKAEEPPHQVYVVLCDLTKSTDDPTVRPIIVKHAAEIARRVPENSTVHYLAIEDRDYNSKLLTISKELPVTEKPSQLKKRRKGFALLPDSVSKTIDSFKPNFQKTCVTHALKRAYEILSDERTIRPNALLRLVILSDMVEECPTVRIGDRYGVDLRPGTTGQRAADFADLQAVKWRIVNFELLNPQVFIVFESKNSSISYNGRKVELPRWEMESLWLTILPHFGIDPKQVSISVTDLPNTMFH